MEGEMQGNDEVRDSYSCCKSDVENLKRGGEIRVREREGDRRNTETQR